MAKEFAKKDALVMKEILRGKNDKYAVTSDINDRRTIFKTKWLEFLRKKNFDFLEIEDWLVPISFPLFVGAKLYELTQDEFKFGDVVNALSTLTEPLFELSVLSGVNQLIESANYSESEKAVSMLSSMASSYLLQALPTLGGQMSRIIDNKKREYYFVDKNSNIPKGIQRLIGQASSKIPLFSFFYEPSIDVWGREKTYGGIGKRALENTVSPGYYSKENYTAVDKELRRLYEKTGELDVLPTVQEKYFRENNVAYYMTAKEYNEAKKIRGQRSFELVEELLSDKKPVKLLDEHNEYRTKIYSEMSDNEKVRAINRCYEEAGEETKEKMLEKLKSKQK